MIPSIEITLALIKPDAVNNGHVGEIITRMEKGFRVCDVIAATWSPGLLSAFYREHTGQPWYSEFEKFMTSAPMYAITLVGDDAVRRWRDLMGATDPKKAAQFTIRHEFGDKVGPIMHNCVHGSDSVERAAKEIEIMQKALRNSPNLGFGERAQEVKRLIEST